MRLLWLLRSLFLAAFAAGTFGSAYLFVKRGSLEEMDWQAAGHGDVYGVPDLGPQLKGFHVEGRNLSLKIAHAGACKGWRVTGPGGLDTGQQGPYPSIALVQGRHTYVVTPTDCASPAAPAGMAFSILLLPRLEFSTKVATDLADRDFIQVSGGPLPLSLRAAQEFQRWSPPAEDYGAAAVSAARAFLRERGIGPGPAGIDMLARIAKAVAGLLPPGDAPVYLNDLGPAEIMDEALTRRAEAFSERHRTLVQTFLSNVAGLPSRIVWSGRVIDGVALSAHAFVESYVAEQARWAYSDLSHGIAYVTDARGLVLNGADILSAVSNLAGGGLTAWSPALPPAPVAWAPVQDTLARHYDKNATLTFWSGRDRTLYKVDPPFPRSLEYRARRYLFEPRFYFGYQRSENLHWLRAGLLALSLFSGLVLIALFWPRRKAR